jgi:hypothetical protein
VSAFSFQTNNRLVISGISGGSTPAECPGGGRFGFFKPPMRIGRELDVLPDQQAHGRVIWSKPLSSGAMDGTARGGYNNPIYDEDHDVIYVSS